MNFKQRVKLEEQYKDWMKKNHAKDCAFSVITFLEETGVIPRWIPVTEKLPENGNEVLTVDKIGLVVPDCYIKGEWYEFPGDVVAWMPIPEWEGEK